MHFLELIDSFTRFSINFDFVFSDGFSSNMAGVAVDAELVLSNPLIKEHKGPINKLILIKHKVISAGQDHLIKVRSLKTPLRFRFLEHLYVCLVSHPSLRNYIQTKDVLMDKEGGWGFKETGKNFLDLS